MRRSGESNFQQAGHKLLTLLAALFVAALEGLAQEQKGGRTGASPQCNLAAELRPDRRIVVSIPDRKLALLENGRVVKIYPVAVGAEASPSPAGEFKIVHRIPQPTYYAPGKVIPPGPANPLGTRWLGLSQKSFGIHGTNEPWSIGRNSSHGCIRMRNRDVEDLFERVRAGDRVELHVARTNELAQIFGVPRAPATLSAEQGKGRSTAAIAVVAAVTMP